MTKHVITADILYGDAITILASSIGIHHRKYIFIVNRVSANGIETFFKVVHCELFLQSSFSSLDKDIEEITIDLESAINLYNKY